MINKEIVCLKAGIYPDGITRGKSYQVIEIDNDKEMVRIKSDNGRFRWFPIYNFNISGEKITDLISWKFDDEVTDDPNETNWIEISIKMSDGCVRWCILYTPERLSNALQQPNTHPPGINIKHMMVVKRYNAQDVQSVLEYLNQEDELINATLAL